MNGQLALVDVPAVPSITPRQQRALEIVTDTRTDGIHADELGAILHEEHHKHSRETRCMFDGANGRSILEALKKKGLVKYRRGTRALAGTWVAMSVTGEVVHPTGMLRDDEELPF